MFSHRVSRLIQKVSAFEIPAVITNDSDTDSNNNNDNDSDSDNDNADNKLDVNILLVLLRTINFAAEKHSKYPRRKPYISHPVGVANILSEYGVYDITILQAAILHATAEICPPEELVLDVIAKIFGENVADLVEEVVNDSKQILTSKRETKKLTDSAKLIGLADKIDNLRTFMKRVQSQPEAWSKERIAEHLEKFKQSAVRYRGCEPKMEAVFDKLISDLSKTK